MEFNGEVPVISLRMLVNFGKQLLETGKQLWEFLMTEPPDIEIPWFWDLFGTGDLLWLTIENPFPSIGSMVLSFGGIGLGVILLVRLISHFIPN